MGVSPRSVALGAAPRFYDETASRRLRPQSSRNGAVAARARVPHTAWTMRRRAVRRAWDRIRPRSLPVAAGSACALVLHGIPAVVYGLDRYDAVFLGALIAVVAWVPCGLLVGWLGLRLLPRLPFREAFAMAFVAAALVHAVVVWRTHAVVDDQARASALRMLTALQDDGAVAGPTELDRWLVERWVASVAVVGLASSTFTGVGALLGMLLFGRRADIRELWNRDPTFGSGE
jgi:hypothetical protein